MGNRLLTILLAVMLVVVIAGGAAVYFFVLAPRVMEPVTLLVPEIFVTDLADRGHIRAELYVELADKRYTSDFERRSVAIVDAVYCTLRNSTRSELTGSEGQERLRQELLVALREVVAGNDLRNLYFKQIVID